MAALVALASRTVIEITSVSPTAPAFASGGAMSRPSSFCTRMLHGLALDDLDLGLDRSVVEVDDLVLEQPVLAAWLHEHLGRRRVDRGLQRGEPDSGERGEHHGRDDDPLPSVDDAGVVAQRHLGVLGPHELPEITRHPANEVAARSSGVADSSEDVVALAAGYGGSAPGRHHDSSSFFDRLVVMFDPCGTRGASALADLADDARTECPTALPSLREELA